MGPGGWGSHFRSFTMSAPVAADLLDAGNWTSGEPLGRDPGWLDGRFGGWLEGNAVLAPGAVPSILLRVDVKDQPEKAALITIGRDGKARTFDPETGFFDFPGGAKKFTVRYDAQSRHYWSLANYVPEWHQGGDAEKTRNTVALVRSPDLREWEVRCIVLYHPDTTKHAFQYLDWRFDGDDLIAVARTAHDDGAAGAASQHDANFLTFHRFPRFRDLTLWDSVPLPERMRTRRGNRPPGP